MSNLNKTTDQYPLNESIVDNIFKDTIDFPGAALEIFRYQYSHNPVYRAWCDTLGVSSSMVQQVADIPFLPISFFKTHTVVSGIFEPEIVFESSGTTQTINSKHLVKSLEVYRQSFVKAFEREYGPISNWCVIGLLPAYLERQHSSLVKMVDDMIQLSGHADSGFYLYDHDKLAANLSVLEQAGTPVLLIGVTFGLLDFAEGFPMQLQHTVVMETGGMKGRRKEITRYELHDYLKQQLGISSVHAEYGMTELLSQAYAKGEGRFHCPPWMKVLPRDEEDPLLLHRHGRGVLNIIDLANIHSCSFIATEDVGQVHPDGSFEVWGRMDNSDIRGCSLLVV
ncbi:LuxE/PaaK family acyltransferase [Deminuibacter soli]|uniref:Acyl transferase n=1 Tax=Deminuibacter soli TaxID=2291815 RepID=A0A3E1NGZ0_9BACT|nr:acyl transferase [Deminuibacter soli]RFM27068.1 acyl transferase [Deminuibacter soli]